MILVQWDDIKTKRVKPSAFLVRQGLIKVYQADLLVAIVRQGLIKIKLLNRLVSIVLREKRMLLQLQHLHLLVSIVPWELIHLQPV